MVSNLPAVYKPFTPVREVEIYSDLNTQTPGLSSRVLNARAIRNAIFNGLLQPKMQRLWRPKGFNIEDFLFRLSEAAVEEEIRNYVRSMEDDDPRFEMIRELTRILIMDKEHHLMDVQLAFSIPPLNEIVYTARGTIRY